MAQPHDENWRPTSEEKVEYFHRDQNVPQIWSPNDTAHNYFEEVFSRQMNLMERINWEEGMKYSNRYMARSKANTEIRSIPWCFERCVRDPSTSELTVDEKNCMVECYFRKQSTRDDLAFFSNQVYTTSKFESTKLDHV